MNLPKITKQLIVICILVFVIQQLRPGWTNYLALFAVGSPFFHLWQPITYMFLHGGFAHIFLNMFALLMFGPQLENIWGPRKFTNYYLICGIGAGLVQMVVLWLMKDFYVPTVGASGAIYGLLIGFALLFPDAPIMLIFPPIRLKAKWWVVIWIAIELVMGFTSDGVAHFAHLGGMLFGYLLVTLWKKQGKLYDYE